MLKFGIKNLSFFLTRPKFAQFLKKYHQKIILSTTCSFLFYTLTNGSNSIVLSKTKPKFVSSSENCGFTIFSKQDKTPLSSGFLISKEGKFLTILNVFATEDQPDAKLINSALYYAQIWNDSATYSIKIDYVLPEENLAFGHFEKNNASPKEFPSIDLNIENFEIGNKVYLFSKSKNKSNIIEQGFIVDKGFNGLDMMIKLQNQDTTAFGSAVMSKEGQIIGMVQPTNPAKYGQNLLVIGGNVLKNISEQYIQKGEVKKAYLGLSVKISNDNLMVIKINSGGPANSAGMKLGDIIQEVNGKAIESVIDFIRSVGYQKNEKIIMKVLRNGEVHNLEITTD